MGRRTKKKKTPKNECHRWALPKTIMVCKFKIYYFILPAPAPALNTGIDSKWRENDKKKWPNGLLFYVFPNRHHLIMLIIIIIDISGWARWWWQWLSKYYELFIKFIKYTLQTHKQMLMRLWFWVLGLVCLHLHQ